MARKLISLEDLWTGAPSCERVFEPAQISQFPEPARKYLEHAIAPGTRFSSAVRLRMHGEIKLKGWSSFSAEQVIRWDRGMLWRAVVRLYGLPIRGGDTFLDGEGAMHWKLFGILAIVNASGPNITRSAAGRANIESIWLPAVLSGEDVLWTASDVFHCHARFTAHNETAEIDYEIEENGRLKAVSMPRWGNPEGAEFHYVNCGGFVDAQGSFSGYTIPTRMRVGWHFGTERFEPEGEFFRVTIDNAEYR